MTEDQCGTDGGHSRRRFLQGAAGAAVGMGALSVGTATVAAHPHDGKGSGKAKIDVHAHYLPADYRQALIDNGQSHPDGFPVLPIWSPQAHLAMMDQVGIRTAMLSVSSPGVTFGPDPVAWARSVNETGAATVRQHPGRFGLLASLRSFSEIA